MKGFGRVWKKNKKDGREEHSQNVIHKKNKINGRNKKKILNQKRKKTLKSNVLSVPGATPCGRFVFQASRCSQTKELDKLHDLACFVPNGRDGAELRPFYCFISDPFDLIGAHWIY